MTKLFTLMVFIIPSVVFAYGGGLDSNGGHKDRKRGGYTVIEPLRHER